jgi:hypothetical protein
VSDIRKAASDLIDLARQVKTSREMSARLKAAADALQSALDGQGESTRKIRADSIKLGNIVVPKGRPMTVSAIEPRWDGGMVSVRFDRSPVQHYFEPDELLEIVSREREDQS